MAGWASRRLVQAAVRESLQLLQRGRRAAVQVSPHMAAARLLHGRMAGAAASGGVAV